MQVAAVLVKLFILSHQSTTYTTQQNGPSNRIDPLNPLKLHTTVAIQIEQTELLTDVPSAVIETICSILELSPFSLVEVEGTHLDTVTVKLKHISPTALKDAAATDCVLAALLKIQSAESSGEGGGGGGTGTGAGTGTGTRTREGQRIRTRDIESTSSIYSDSDDYDNGDAQQRGWRGRGGGKGYGDLVPEFRVSLLHLVNESTSIIFEAEKGAVYRTVTAMTRCVRTSFVSAH